MQNLVKQYSVVGANFELKKFFKPHARDFQSELSLDGISWNCIPPKSQYFGGLWKAGAKSVKRYLKHVYEEFITMLSKIEAYRNSRPLYSLSSDPSDPSSLIPSHFIIRESITAIPDSRYLALAKHKLGRYQEISWTFLVQLVL